MNVSWMGQSIAAVSILLKFKRDDTLRLQQIHRKNLGTDMDQYRHCLVRFLQDPCRSGKYAIGDNTYTKATLGCIQLLESIGTNAKGSLDEHVLSNHINLDNGVWTFERTGSSLYSTSANYFIYLGYAYYFLSRSGKSRQLVQHCQRPTFLTGPGITLFPTRTALVRQAMEDYLERVEGEPFQE